MAISKQALTLTNLGNGLFQVQIGPETFQIESSVVKEYWNGRREPLWLVFQAFVVLVQAGLNPNTASFAQIKTVLEAQTYWWGN